MLKYSVVIPTLNEERYLPILLNSIKEQNHPPKLIIVADSYSTDNTKLIADGLGCVVVSGGNPAQGRNYGFRSVTTDLVIFIDADAKLPYEYFISDCINEFVSRKLDFASCLAKNLPTNKLKGRMSILVSNIRRILDQILYSLFGMTLGASGWFLIVKADVFRKLGGFDESYNNLEDLDFYRRALKKGFKFGILNRFAHLSGRRYDDIASGILFLSQLNLLLHKIGVKGRLPHYEKYKGKMGGN